MLEGDTVMGVGGRGVYGERVLYYIMHFGANGMGVDIRVLKVRGINVGIIWTDARH